MDRAEKPNILLLHIFIILNENNNPDNQNKTTTKIETPNKTENI